MKLLFTFFSLLFLYTAIFANGVCIDDASKGSYLLLTSSVIEVNVENQVSITTAKQIFKNQFPSIKKIKYAFPLPAGASATKLSWKINGNWHTAAIGTSAQDSSLPGSGGTIAENLKNYLGKTPLYFNIQDEVSPDSLIEVELTYVELLSYSYGNVHYTYPNNYSLIQTQNLDLQSLHFNLISEREITYLSITSSQTVTEKKIEPRNATITCATYNSQANENYDFIYSLSLKELGLFSFSTLIPSNELPDKLGGFLLFSAEPDPTNATESIKKVFTLVIDRSGSMEWDNRLIQAKSAAKYIINNLNEGDKFNIVDFARFATSLSEYHLDNNSQNQALALSYIDKLEPTWTPELSGTNVSGAFDKAIPQFSSADNNTANIIIFLTDGEANLGITSTDEIVSHIHSLASQYQINLSIFTFGLGLNISQQMLTLIASDNNGEAEFVANNSVENKITDFYRKIRNPVLLGVKVSFDPSIVDETYPSKIPNLYKGQQFILTGRYKEAKPVSVTLSGNAFGKNIEYKYQINLSDSSANEYKFLPKIWAKNKIESLLVQYYSLDANSNAANEIKSQIIAISVSFGVTSPFTSFTNQTSVKNDIIRDKDKSGLKDFELLGNYPNPFNPATHIRFRVNADYAGVIYIRIYNSLGELVKVIEKRISGIGEYELTWDGKDQYGNILPSGNYIYLLNYEDSFLAGKMQLLK